MESKNGTRKEEEKNTMRKRRTTLYLLYPEFDEFRRICEERGTSASQEINRYIQRRIDAYQRASQ